MVGLFAFPSVPMNPREVAGELPAPEWAQGRRRSAGRGVGDTPEVLSHELA